jgi:limonene-1,2-epoxide hydrolase
VRAQFAVRAAILFLTAILATGAAADLAPLGDASYVILVASISWVTGIIVFRMLLRNRMDDLSEVLDHAMREAVDRADEQKMDPPT